LGQDWRWSRERRRSRQHGDLRVCRNLTLAAGRIVLAQWMVVIQSRDVFSGLAAASRNASSGALESVVAAGD